MEGRLWHGFRDERRPVKRLLILATQEAATRLLPAEVKRPAAVELQLAAVLGRTQMAGQCSAAAAPQTQTRQQAATEL